MTGLYSPTINKHATGHAAGMPGTVNISAVVASDEHGENRIMPIRACMALNASLSQYVYLSSCLSVRLSTHPSTALSVSSTSASKESQRPGV